MIQDWWLHCSAGIKTKAQKRKEKTSLVLLPLKTAVKQGYAAPAGVSEER